MSIPESIILWITSGIIRIENYTDRLWVVVFYRSFILEISLSEPMTRPHNICFCSALIFLCVLLI